MCSTVPMVTYQHAQSVSTQILSTPSTTLLNHHHRQANISAVRKSLRCQDYLATITTFVGIFALILVATILLSRAAADYSASTQPRNCIVWTNLNLTGIHAQTQRLGLGGGPRCIMWKNGPLKPTTDTPLNLNTIIAACVLSFIALILGLFIIIGVTGKECCA